jgi:ATP-dependent RNA helicase DDX18/HAS1
MPSSTINKKRKRRDAEAVVEDKASGKKSKKVVNPAPAEAEEDEEVQEAIDEIVDGDEDRPAASDHEDDDEAGAELSNAEGLPSASAPILAPPADSESFDELRLSERSMKAINDMGFTKMTAIQRSVCFFFLRCNGKDLSVLT